MTTQIQIPDDALLVKQTEPFTALCFTTHATHQTLAQHNYVPGELYEEVDRLHLTPAGPIQYVYTGVNGDAANEFLLEMALPVDNAGNQEPSGKFSFKTLEPFHCVSYTFAGSWDDFWAMYDALFAAFHQRGYQTDQRVREVYAVVDFEDKTKCVTEIQIGLA